MGIDRPVDDDDIPADDGDTTLIEAINGLGDDLIELDPDTIDDSTRLQYQLQYREKVDATCLAYARERWAADKPRLEAEWSDHARQHAAPADAAPDLGEATIANVKRGCEQIRETEDSIIGPAIRAIEAQDPDRQLVGFDNRLNSWWQSSEKEQLFEVQFHTQISFEAKQLTHEAYERLRCGAACEKERDQLDAFQQRVTAYVPVPRGAFDYSEFP